MLTSRKYQRNPSKANSHPLDLLVVNHSYVVDNFTGSSPKVNQKLLVHKRHWGIWGASPPVWKHTSCVVTVGNEDGLGKHLLIAAKVDTDPDKTTTPYGIQGDYQIEVCLKKQGGGIVCTKIQGVSGTLSFPTGGSTFIDDQVKKYGLGTEEKPLNLPVNLKPNGDGTFNLEINVDPVSLGLDKSEDILISTAYNFAYSLGFVGESKLEGKIDLRPEKKLSCTTSVLIGALETEHGDKIDIKTQSIDLVTPRGSEYHEEKVSIHVVTPEGDTVDIKKVEKDEISPEGVLSHSEEEDTIVSNQTGQHFYRKKLTTHAGLFVSTEIEEGKKPRSSTSEEQKEENKSGDDSGKRPGNSNDKK